MHTVRTAAGAAGSQALLDGYTRYLRAERGVSAVTVDAYLSDVGRFLARRGGSDLGEVASRSPASVRQSGCTLRSFLRYCYLAGLVGHDLSAAAPPVSGRRRSLLRQGIGPAQAKALLGACDRRRATGRRDYAVIVLMLRLGLHADEVAALRREDLDWRVPPGTTPRAATGHPTHCSPSSTACDYADLTAVISHPASDPATRSAQSQGRHNRRCADVGTTPTLRACSGDGLALACAADSPDMRATAATGVASAAAVAGGCIRTRVLIACMAAACKVKRC